MCRSYKILTLGNDLVCCGNALLSHGNDINKEKCIFKCNLENRGARKVLLKINSAMKREVHANYVEGVAA